MRTSTKILLIWIIFSASMIGFFGFRWLTYTPTELGFKLSVLLVNDTRSNSIFTVANLDEAIHVSYSDYCPEDLNYGVIILNDIRITINMSNKLIEFVKNGGGLIIILGNKTTYSSGLDLLNITTRDKFIRNEIDGVTEVVDSENIIAKNIAWNSIPEAKNYTVIPKDLLEKDVNVILKETSTGDPLLMEKRIGKGMILVYTPWLSDEYNREIRLWPYFNYFIFSSILYVSGHEEDIPRYNEWPYSPVPHPRDSFTIGIYVFVLSILISLAFIYMRHYSEKHPFKEVYAVTAEERKIKREKMLKDLWERVGAHRPLAGFLYVYFLMILILIPVSFVVAIIFPRYIVPFPQAQGWYNWTVNFFQALWVAFDMGTSVALVKYFAEYRVKHPEIAIRYVQIFVWWQMLTGVVQLFLVAFIGSFFFSQTFLAHMSWVIATHSIIQFPGMLLVFMYFFNGLQRQDYYEMTSIMYYAVFIYLGQIITVLFFREWGASNPVFGEALGAAIGLAVGDYLSRWLTFGFTVILYKRLGFSLKSIFRVDFTAEDVKRALIFGGKWTFGNIWVPFVWFLQMYLLSIWLLNYSAWIGYYSLAWGIAQIVGIISLFADQFLSALSESFTHKKQILTDYYLAQALKWANLFDFFLVSSLFAIGARFILGASGPMWAPAIVLFGPLLIFQLLGPYSWLGDAILAGVGRTGRLAMIWIMEQSTRAILLFFFIPKFGMVGVVYAYIPGLLLKDIGAWYFIRKYVGKPKPYWWQTWIAPAISALINYAWLEIASRIIWIGDVLSSMIIFLLGIFFGVYVYFFIVGFTGAFDKNTLEEFAVAARMVKGVGILARGLMYMTKLGSKISPFFNKFPIDIYDEAIREAEELTRGKEVLKL